MLPLHRAKGSEVAKYLIDLYPESIKVNNCSGSLPLEFASYYGNLEHIKHMIELYPESILPKNCNGCLPLHSACHDSSSLEVVHCLVQQYRPALEAKCSDGGLPLQCAVQRYYQSLDVLKYLVEGYPDALKVKDDKGCIPLQYACCERATLPVIQYLVQKPPDGIKELKYILNHYVKSWVKSYSTIRWVRVGKHILLRFLVDQKRVALVEIGVLTVGERKKRKVLSRCEPSEWELMKFIFVDLPEGNFASIMLFL